MTAVSGANGAPALPASYPGPGRLADVDGRGMPHRIRSTGHLTRPAPRHVRAAATRHYPDWGRAVPRHTLPGRRAWQHSMQ